MTFAKYQRRLFEICFFSLALGSVSHAIQREHVLKEAESLYQGLKENDKVRPGLALRYADLLFDSAIELSGSLQTTEKDMDQADRYRQAAKSLYENILTGFGGKFPRPSAPHVVRMEFQLARIAVAMGDTPRALGLWRELSQQKITPAIRTESQLHLAEHLELSMDAKVLQEAKNLYTLVLAEVGESPIAPYVNHRLGWTEYRLGSADRAIIPLKFAIAKADANSKPEIFADLVLFHSRSSLAPQQALADLQKMAGEYKLSDPIQSLALAYAEADRPTQQVQLLQIMEKENPSLGARIELLDLYVKDARYQDYENLARDTNLKLSSDGLNRTLKSASEGTLLNLAAHWDGERRAKKEFSPALLDETVKLFARAFSMSPKLAQVLDGWALAHPEALRRVVFWTELTRGTHRDVTDVQPLEKLVRERRWHPLAETQKISEAILDLEYLAKVFPAPENRKFTYEQAKLERQNGNSEKALLLFQGLAVLPQSGDPDEVALFSQNSALDILSQQKRYADVKAQALTWTAARPAQLLAKTIGKGSPLSSEVQNMGVIAAKAEFEQNVADDSDQSLQYFHTACAKKEFFPTSCENTLARALSKKDAAVVFFALQSLERQDDLAWQYERWGFFAEAAMLREKLNGSSQDFSKLMRTSLLYELAGDLKSRDRLLKTYVAAAAPRFSKLSDDEKALLFLTLKEAHLFSLASYDWSWSAGQKAELSHWLWQTGKATPKIRNDFVEVCAGQSYIDPSLFEKELKDLDRDQSKINFLGAGSQKKFQRRVATLKQMDGLANCLRSALPSNESEKVAAQMAASYGEFGQQILQTPIPPDVPAEMVEQVKSQIQDMASPFVASAESRRKEAGNAPESFFRDLKPRAPAKMQNSMEANDLKVAFFRDLRKDPENAAVLKDWQMRFQEASQPRLSGYLSGRLQALVGPDQEGVKQ